MPKLLVICTCPFDDRRADWQTLVNGTFFNDIKDLHVTCLATLPWQTQIDTIAPLCDVFLKATPNVKSISVYMGWLEDVSDGGADIGGPFDYAVLFGCSTPITVATKVTMRKLISLSKYVGWRIISGSKPQEFKDTDNDAGTLADEELKQYNDGLIRMMWSGVPAPELTQYMEQIHAAKLPAKPDAWPAESFNEFVVAVASVAFQHAPYMQRFFSCINIGPEPVAETRQPHIKFYPWRADAGQIISSWTNLAYDLVPERCNFITRAQMRWLHLTKVYPSNTRVLMDTAKEMHHIVCDKLQILLFCPQAFDTRIISSSDAFKQLIKLSGVTEYTFHTQQSDNIYSAVAVVGSDEYKVDLTKNIDENAFIIQMNTHQLDNNIGQQVANSNSITIHHRRHYNRIPKFSQWQPRLSIESVRCLIVCTLPWLDAQGAPVGQLKGAVDVGFFSDLRKHVKKHIKLTLLGHASEKFPDITDESIQAYNSLLSAHDTDIVRVDIGAIDDMYAYGTVNCFDYVLALGCNPIIFNKSCLSKLMQWAPCIALPAIKPNHPPKTLDTLQPHLAGILDLKADNRAYENEFALVLNGIKPKKRDGWSDVRYERYIRIVSQHLTSVESVIERLVTLFEPAHLTINTIGFHKWKHVDIEPRLGIDIGISSMPPPYRAYPVRQSWYVLAVCGYNDSDVSTYINSTILKSYMTAYNIKSITCDILSPNVRQAPSTYILGSVSYDRLMTDINAVGQRLYDAILFIDCDEMSPVDIKSILQNLFQFGILMQAPIRSPRYDQYIGKMMFDFTTAPNMERICAHIVEDPPIKAPAPAPVVRGSGEGQSMGAIILIILVLFMIFLLVMGRDDATVQSKTKPVVGMGDSVAP